SVDGKRKRRYVYGRTKQDATRKLRTAVAEREAGTLAGTRVPTTGAWLQTWLDTIAARRVRPSTLERYESIIRTWITPAIGHHRLDRLAPEHVEAAYLAMERAGLASATVLQAHRILSRALKVAVQRGKVGRNVCTLIDAPSLVQDEVDPLTAGEARDVLATAAGRRNAARWSVALAV